MPLCLGQLRSTAHPRQTERQQDRKVVNGTGGEMSTLHRANIALSRWLQNEARFHDPTFQKVRGTRDVIPERRKTPA